MPQNIPTVGTVWRRKDNHNQCRIYTIANITFKGKHKKDFPVIVVMLARDKVLALTLEKFNELMEEMPRR